MASCRSGPYPPPLAGLLLGRPVQLPGLGSSLALPLSSLPPWPCQQHGTGPALDGHRSACLLECQQEKINTNEVTTMESAYRPLMEGKPGLGLASRGCIGSH